MAKQPIEHTKFREKGRFWVNGPINCIGRFTPQGYEISRALSDKPERNEKASGNTLSVKVHPTNSKDWDNFVTLMKQHHGVDLSKEEYPDPEKEVNKGKSNKEKTE